ncbi:hypothetical protein LIER_32909 [Lithospermum erythrorhizon]|uniref:Uncharacterized protein n=1 Tax=Lithospermum erythrorhizon TaxID=34254 RepID=A0AAV3S0Z2_LITER
MVSSATIDVPFVVTPAVSENVSEFGSNDGEMLYGPGLDGGVPVQVVADLADQPAVSVASGSGVPELVPAALVSAGAVRWGPWRLMCLCMLMILFYLGTIPLQNSLSKNI